MSLITKKSVRGREVENESESMRLGVARRRESLAAARVERRQLIYASFSFLMGGRSM